MTQPLISVLVLNFKSPQPTVRCVESLLQQTIADQIEILVLDNHSADDSIGVLRNRLGHYPQVRLIETPRNGGFGYGYNMLASYAQGEYLLINNPDKVLQADGLEQLASYMDARADIGVLAPALMHHDGSRRLSARAFPSPLDALAKRTVLRHIFPGRVQHYLQLDKDPEQERRVDWVVGGCFMVSRQLFEELGGFDERFFLFFEDTDFCRRAWEAGRSIVYYPQVQGADRKRRLSEGSIWSLLTNRVGRAHIASGIRYFRKWGILPKSYVG